MSAGPERVDPAGFKAGDGLRIRTRLEAETDSLGRSRCCVVHSSLLLLSTCPRIYAGLAIVYYEVASWIAYEPQPRCADLPRAARRSGPGAEPLGGVGQRAAHYR